MHSTAGGAKPRLGVGGGEKKEGARGRLPVEPWKLGTAEHIGRQARGQMAKQERHSTRIALPKADLKLHLKLQL